MSLAVRIFRYNPAKDKQPRYQTYQVPKYFEGDTVVSVLEYIFENLDPSLAFNRSCRKSLCSGCTAVINGRPGLLCRTEVKGDLTIEPTRGFEVVRDLVVAKRKNRKLDK